MSAATRRDPTQTAAIRSQYERDVVHRFTVVNAWVKVMVDDMDAFYLRDPILQAAANPAEDALRKYNIDPWGDRSPVFDRLHPDIASRVPLRRFAFPTDEAKIEAFMDWLDAAIDAALLEVTRGPAGRIAFKSNWQDIYVRAGYARALAQAVARLQAAGVENIPEEPLQATFNRPTHVQALGALYSRNFRELRGVSQAMAQQLSRTLAEGFSQGWGAEKIARALRDSIEEIGMARARLLARTEVIRAHADATLLRYEEAGIRQVIGAVELLTAGDLKVCQICRALEEQGPISIEEARGVIPVHPLCRCAWIPVVEPL